jgi:hypothetical protein
MVRRTCKAVLLVVERNGHLQKFCRRTDTLGEVSASGCVDFVLFEIGIWTVSVVIRYMLEVPLTACGQDMVS